jgi:hypothetical protein
VLLTNPSPPLPKPKLRWSLKILKSHNKQDIQRIPKEIIPTEIIPTRNRKLCCEGRKIIIAI